MGALGGAQESLGDFSEPEGTLAGCLQTTPGAFVLDGLLHPSSAPVTVNAPPTPPAGECLTFLIHLTSLA